MAAQETLQGASSGEGADKKKNKNCAANGEWSTGQEPLLLSVIAAELGVVRLEKSSSPRCFTPKPKK